jgi:hypothetical protein
MLNWYRGSLPVVKPLGREDKPSPPSSTEAKNEWNYTSAPPICLRGVDREKLPLPSLFALGNLIAFNDSIEHDFKLDTTHVPCNIYIYIYIYIYIFPTNVTTKFTYPHMGDYSNMFRLFLIVILR